MVDQNKEESIPWRDEGLSHRVSQLEAQREIAEERSKYVIQRIETLEATAKTHDAKIEEGDSSRQEMMKILSKMQGTLEELNKVLAAYNKWENTKSGLTDIGNFLIWIAKVGAVVSVLYGVFHFGTNYSNTVSQQTRPPVVQNYEARK